MNGNQIIIPENKQQWLEARTKDITSTEVSALFGFNPYITEFELWHNKKSGEVHNIEETERMKWGTALQDAIANEIAKERGWTIRRMDEYIRSPKNRIGASFDFMIEKMPDVEGSPIATLEIKNVDSLAFMRSWSVEDQEAPLHIEIQKQQQLMLSGRPFGYIGALVGGNTLHLFKREANPKVFTAIIDRVEKFWKSIENNTPPQPNFERDAEFIAKMYSYADPTKIINVQGEEILAKAREYKRLGDVAKEADETRKAIKAELLTIIGDAEKAHGDGFKISAGIIGESEIAYTRKAYRDFRITWSK